jgi:hypothetical protein
MWILCFVAILVLCHLSTEKGTLVNLICFPIPIILNQHYSNLYLKESLQIHRKRSKMEGFILVSTRSV